MDPNLKKEQNKKLEEQNHKAELEEIIQDLTQIYKKIDQAIILLQESGKSLNLVDKKLTGELYENRSVITFLKIPNLKQDVGVAIKHLEKIIKWSRLMTSYYSRFIENPKSVMFE